MADALLARATLSRKENSHIDANDVSDVTASGEISAFRPSVPEDWKPNPRTVIIGDHAYVAGLLPPMRLDEIHDIPAEMKAHLADACLQKNTCAKTDQVASESNSCLTVRNERAEASGSVSFSRCSAHARTAAPRPVLDRMEIAAARGLLRLLDQRRLALIDDNGLLMADGHRVRPDLCNKLEDIGVIAIVHCNGSLVVRRVRSTEGSTSQN